MSIVDKLASVINEKPSIANKQVANECINNPNLIDEIIENINHKNQKLAFDCVEVLTMIAQEKPELVLQYSESIFKLLKHKKSNIRWEVAHTLALTAHINEKFLVKKLEDIMEIIDQDDSIVVRDYAVDIFANYASVNENEAINAYPYLVEALTVHNARHAGHALDGLVNVVYKTNRYNDEILKMIEPFIEDSKKVVAQKAKKLMKLILNKK